MSETGLTQIQTETESYERHYPNIVELALKQLEEQFWTSREMKVELDKMQLLHDLSPERQHAIKFVLNLFVRYELSVGDMWQRMGQLFPRPEVKMAASIIDMVERAVHAEFYNEVNIQMGLDKEEHYMAFLENPELKKRVDWLGRLMSPRAKDPILGVIIFSMTETALLFSSFAILKSFQTNGLNMIPVIVRGTNQSAKDEDLHGLVSAEIINTYYRELGTTLFADKDRYEKVRQAVHYAFEHESLIIREAIPSGVLNGTTVEEFEDMIKYRLNVYCERLGLPHEFVPETTTVRDWFEEGTASYKMPDFFTPGMPMEYEMSWDEDAFVRALEKEAKIEGGKLVYGN
jgi:ribonucleotide reductase beta subunit family protein with ferritin-like domain